jgi:putative N6-adenine-specific DNA methylase
VESFFLVVPPGLEKLALSELNEKVPGLEIVSSEKGGLNIQAPLSVALALNTALKIPNSIRWRIAEFKCRDFPKLFNKIQSIRWNRYLVSDKYELSVQCSKSRLLNEKRVEAAVRDGITRFFEKQPPKQVKGALALQIHVRFFDDVCSLSIDLSGEPLFKRGYKVMSGLAPIRENLAAGLFYALWEASGRKIDTLIDPLCGTGTLLFEAQMFSQNSKMRQFAYEARADWPAETLALAQFGPKYFYGFDRDEKSLQNAMESLGVLSQGTEIDKSNWFFAKRDLFAPGSSYEIRGDRKAVICNPPYGERISFSKKPAEYYSDLRSAVSQFSPSLIGVVVPQTFLQHWPETFSSYNLVDRVFFENGGIEVVFLVYRR